MIDFLDAYLDWTIGLPALGSALAFAALTFILCFVAEFVLMVILFAVTRSATIADAALYSFVSSATCAIVNGIFAWVRSR